jgi:hypothetical protein
LLSNYLKKYIQVEKMDNKDENQFQKQRLISDSGKILGKKISYE